MKFFESRWIRFKSDQITSVNSSVKGRVHRSGENFRVFGHSLAKFGAMKSAYELAMERLAKSDPDAGKPLSAEQKDRLAEIDRVYQGKLAEREIFLKKQLNDAYADQKGEEVQKIKQQIVSERARLEEEREEEKERVRRGK